MSARLDTAALQPGLGALPGDRRLLSAGAAYRWAGTLAPWFAGVGALLTAAALGTAIFGARPAGLDQAAAWPIALVHQPAAWAAWYVYVVMAACAALAFGWVGRVPAVALRALAPSGALFTLLALCVGGVLGDGTWSARASDAQLASQSVLLVLYAGVLLLRPAIPDPARADRACAALVLVGVFNLPIIYLSVQWWDRLHGAAAAGTAAPAALPMGLHGSMLLMIGAFCLYALGAAMARLRCLMLQEAAVAQPAFGENRDR